MGAEAVAGLVPGDPLDALPGIGGRRAERLAEALGTSSVGALLRVTPLRYEEPAPEVPPAAWQEGDRVRVRARVLGASTWRRGRRSLLTVRLEAGGTRVAALYFNQPYLRAAFPSGREVLLEGQVRVGRGLQLLSPRLIGADEDGAEGLRPVYPDVEGVPGAVLARALVAALEAVAAVEEPLPDPVRLAAGVPPLAEALRLLHAPASHDDVERARRRLAWGEVLSREHRRRRAAGSPERRTPVPARAWQRIRARLPFEPSDEQEAALAVLRADLAGGAPMRRLLHGEVGSGKTAVAFAAMLAVAAAGGQAALLAPTEILARQHLRTFRSWLRGARLEVAAVLGDATAAERRATAAALADGSASLAVGTHALLGADVRFRDLALVVFDEQHRFGVRQKAALVAKGPTPHVLTMTATPIPRTLAWAQYGALDPLVLRTRPGAGGAVTTRVHALADWQRLAADLRPNLEAGERAFVVAPRIDGDGGLLAWRERLLDGPWRGLRAALVHGRMDGDATSAAVEAFRAGEVPVLLGTTVVEVGLDIADVPHMLVMGADRLGLASLHQLRGRLARGVGARPGLCRLLAEPQALERLRLLERCVDGFEVAEADLAERGPGALSGTRQHGRSDFRIFDPARDGDLVALLGREEVRNWLAKLD